MVSVIARRWTALAEGSEQADAYVAHFEGAVRPALESSKGFLGATVERVTVDGAVEIVVVTRWESMDAIKGFAGEQIDLAVVEPQARAVLSRFDDRVRHIELADGQAFGHLESIDVSAEAAAHAPWFNETLTSVNDSVVRLGVIEGDFHWHKHDDQDEFFLVLDGEMFLDVEGEPTVVLHQHQGYTVPKGTVHRPRSPKTSVVLMVESLGIVATGD